MFALFFLLNNFLKKAPNFVPPPSFGMSNPVEYCRKTPNALQEHSAFCFALI